MRSTTRLSPRPRAASSLLRGGLALCLAAWLAGCQGGDKTDPTAQPKRPPVPVGVAAVEQKTVPLTIQAIGTVEASAIVSVKAQVGGELVRVHIKEGQDVKKGDVLFSIDPRTYEAAVAQAEANLARDRGQVQQARAVLERDRARIGQAKAGLLRDQAQSKNAVVQEKRYADLLQRGLIAQEQYDGIRTNMESLAATVGADEADVRSAEDTVRADEAAVGSAEQAVRADEAAVANAKLQLGYTTIRSPVDGRTGALMLHEGNLVRAGGTSDSTLLVINQIRPILVSFTVPQQQLPAINRYRAEGTLRVDAIPAGDTKPVRGVVTFTDNAVDAATGTIRLKASFDNAEQKLWPGQFVNVSLTLATEPDAIVVPSQAVQTGQQGTYVFVVKPDGTVENRPVTVARTQGGDSILAKGLEAGERVVVDGQTRLVAGARVEVRGAEGKGDGKGKRGDAKGAADDGKQRGDAKGAGDGSRGEAKGAGDDAKGERARRGAKADGAVTGDAEAKKSGDAEGGGKARGDAKAGADASASKGSGDGKSRRDSKPTDEAKGPLPSKAP